GPGLAVRRPGRPTRETVVVRTSGKAGQPVSRGGIEKPDPTRARSSSSRGQTCPIRRTEHIKPMHGQLSTVRIEYLPGREGQLAHAGVIVGDGKTLAVGEPGRLPGHAFHLRKGQ